jgi:hypothetical protein
MSFPLSDHETDDDMAVKDSLKSKVFDETMSRSNVSNIIVDKTNNIPGPWHHKLLSSIESLESELLVQAQSLQYENNDMDDIVATYIHSVEPEVDERCNTKKMTSPEVDCSSSVLPDLQNVSEDSNDFVEINKDDFSNKDIQRPEDEEDSYEFGDFQDERQDGGSSPNLSKENTSSKAVNTEHDEDSFTATATMVSLPKKDTERPEVIPSATDFEIFQSSKSLDSDKVEKKIGFSNFDPLFNDGVIKIGADKPSKEEEVIVGKLTQSSKIVFNQVRRNGNDEFGDFHESAVETPKAITESTNGDLWSSNKIPVLDVSDDIPVEMHMVVVSSETSPDDIEQSVHEKVNGDDDDDFGDFHESSGGQQIAVMESANGDIWRSNNVVPNNVADKMQVSSVDFSEKAIYSDNERDENDVDDFGDFHDSSVGVSKATSDSAIIDVWTSNTVLPSDIIPVKMSVVAVSEPAIDEVPIAAKVDNEYFENIHDASGGISPITTGLYNPDSTISANMALTSHYQSNGSLMTDPFEMITSSDACTDIIPNMSSIGQSEGTSDSYRGGIIASNEVSMGKVLQTNHHNNSFEHVNETVNSTVAVSEMFSSNSNQGIQQHSFSSRQHTNENVKVTHEQGDNNEKEKSNWNVDYNKANVVFSDLMPEITSTTHQNQFNQNGIANNINNGPHSYGVSPSDDNVNLHSQISNTNRGGRHEGNNAYGGGTFQHNSDLISTDQMQISNHLAQNFQASLDTMQEPDDAGARVPNNDSGILEMIKPSNVASSLHIMNISNIAPHLADEDEFGEFQST